MMRRLTLIQWAGAGSAALLLAALGFQMIGYAPCHLCILQRWPHLVAVLVAAVIIVTGWRSSLAPLGMMAAAVATVLAVYHTGVERDWWEGPASCAGGLANLANLSAVDLMAKIEAAPVIRCDEISWSFLSLSMASWNAIFSALLTAIWAVAIIRARGKPAPRGSF